MLRLALESQGHRVAEARDQPEAEAMLASTPPAVVITDLRLPAGDGLGVLRAVKTADATIPVVVMTAYGGVQDAVAAMKEGALDFLAKPVDPEHLELVVGRAVAQQRLVREHERLKQEVAERRGAPRIIGKAPALRKAIQTMQRAAATGITVLLEGESGTGKELFARALHAWSDHAEGPFIAINCAALPETLLESELFGYEKGAFTGAHQRKLGRFELAHHGTLFLDEIGELAPTIQAKILRVLETREFERVGGTATLARRRAAGGGHQSQPASRGGRAPFPRGSLLPAVGDADYRAAAARPRRRRVAAGAVLHRAPRPGVRPHAAGARPGVERGARGVPVAGQRARAAELPGARGHSRATAGSSPRAICI